MNWPPSRLVLEGVPRVEFYSGGIRCPEDVPFPSCVRACLDYLGDSLGCSKVERPRGTRGLDCGYAFLMGVTGAAWQVLWKPGWHMDNCDLACLADYQGAPFRHGFQAIGYDYRHIPDSAGEDAFRAAIADSLTRGRPVLAFGVIPPPECCLVTGYDEGGDVLIGWNCFQNDPQFNAGVEFEPTGEFRKRNWFPDTRALLVVGDRKETPAPGEVCRESLRWALDRMETAWLEGQTRHAGIAAYAAWAEHLARDADFATDELQVLMDRYGAHHSNVCTVAEGRWYGAEYLKMMAKTEPAMAPHLLAAADCCVREHDLMWDVWNAAGGIGFDEARARKFAESQTRRAIIPLIHESQENYRRAAGQLRAALAADERTL